MAVRILLPDSIHGAVHGTQREFFFEVEQQILIDENRFR